MRTGAGPAKGKGATTLWAELSLILTAVFWGTNYVAVKFVVAGIPPLLFVALRFVFAGLVVWGFMRVLEPRSRLERGDLMPMVGLGACGVALGQTAFTYGVSMTSASNTGLVFATSPVWGIILALALGRERPTFRGIVGVGLSIVGVVVVVYRGLGADGASLAGDLLILVAGVMMGVYTVFSLPLLDRYSPLAVATYPMLFGGLVMLPLAAPGLARMDWGALGPLAGVSAVYSTLFATAFAYAFWQRGISRIGANRVLVYQYLITFSGVAAGVLILGENLTPNKLLGGAVILLGVYLARRR